MSPPTRTAVFCDRVIETGWLAAVVVSPLFFNIHSLRIFEPDKAALVRSLALVMCGAWIIRTVEQGVSSAPSIRRIMKTPLVLPVFLLALVVLIGTAFSLTPWISFWGNPWRLQGAGATLAYVWIFIMPALRLNRERADRLISAILLSSVPVALFALIQHVRLDPIPWGYHTHLRAISTLGNPIFLGAWLIMIMFPTLSRIAGLLLRGRDSERPDVSAFLSAGVLAVIFGLQTAALVICGSRGPWLGLIVGLFFMGLILLLFLGGMSGQTGRLSIRERAFSFITGVTGPLGIVLIPVLLFSRRAWRWLWIAWSIAGVVTVLFVLELNRPSSILSPLRGNFYLQRLGGIYDGMRSGEGSINVRTFIWDGSIGILKTNPTVELPDGRPDRFRLFRPLIGFGPETLSAVHGRFYPVRLARIETTSHLRFVDRSHNDTYDVLLTTGAAGFVVRQSILVILFMLAFGQLGWMANRQERILFVGLWIGLGTACAFLAAVFIRPGMIAAGYALGASACVFVYPIQAFLRNRPMELLHYRNIGRLWMTVGLMAAVLAHFVEIQIGMPIVATHVLFWTYAALLSYSPIRTFFRDRVTTEAAVPEEKAADSPPDRLSPAVHGVLTAVVLGTFWFSFVRPIPNPGSISSVMTFLEALFGQGSSGMAITILLAFTALTGLILAEPFRGTASGIARNIAVFLVWFLPAPLFAGILGMIRGWSMASPLADADLLADAAVLASLDLIGFMLFLVFFLLAGAALLSGGAIRRGAPLFRDRDVFWLAPVILIVVLYGIRIHLNDIRSDMVRRQAEAYHVANRWDRAIALCQRAVILCPHSEMAYHSLGAAFFQQALILPPSAAKGDEIEASMPLERIVRMDDDEVQRLSRTGLMTAANIVFQEGRRLAPFNIDHTTALARLHHRWAAISSAPEDRLLHADHAEAYYRQALALNPSDFFILNEWARSDMELNRDTGRVRQTVMRSLDIHPGHAPTHMLMGAVERKEGRPDKALEAYSRALETAPNNPKTAMENARRAAAEMIRIYRDQNRMSDGIALARRMTFDYPAEWWTHNILALLLEQEGRFEEGLIAARKARALSSGANRRQVEGALQRMEQRAMEKTD